MKIKLKIKIKSYLTKKLIPLAIVFFIIYRFWLIVLLFKRRTLLPEPDDSYFYLTEIRKILDSGTLFYKFPLHPLWRSDWSHILTYKLLIIFIHKISNLSLEATFFLSFFLGTVLLVFVLFLFLSKLIKEKQNISWLIFFLAFYSGSGAYHGFYWVVPSFFSIVFFFLILSYIYDDKAKKLPIISLFLLLPLFILSHPMALFALSILIFNSFFLYWLKDKNWKAISIKTFILTIFGILQFSLLELILTITQTKVTPLHYLSPLENLKQVFSGRINLISWEMLRKEYFNLLFPHKIFLLFFMILLGCLLLKRRYKFFSLFFATLTFTLFSLINYYGYRALLFLWPITFLTIGQGIFDFYSILKKTSKLLFSFLVLIFLIILNVFNIVQAKNLNRRDNFSWDKSCPAYLLENTNKNDSIFFGDYLTYNLFLYYGFYRRESYLFSLSKVGQYKELTKGSYLVVHKEQDLPKETLSLPVRILVENVSRKNKLETKTPAKRDNNLMEALKKVAKVELKRNCGHFQILKIFFN